MFEIVDLLQCRRLIFVVLEKKIVQATDARQERGGAAGVRRSKIANSLFNTVLGN